MAMEMVKELQLVESFEKALRPLTPDEFGALRAQVIADGEIRDPLVIWDGKIVDGHHRHRIWAELLGTPDEVATPRIIRKDFASDTEAVAWIRDNQRARRNLTPSEISELRGKKYNAAKGTRGGDQKSKVKDLHFDAAEVIGKEDGVSSRTVKDDGEYHANLAKIHGMLPVGNFGSELVAAEVPKSVVASISVLPNRPAMQDALELALAAGKKAKVASSGELKEAARKRRARLKTQREEEAARKAKWAEQAAQDAKRQRKAIEKSRKGRKTKAMNKAKKDATDEQVEQLEQYSKLRTSLQIAGILPDEDIDALRHIISQNRVEVFEDLTEDEFELLERMMYSETTRRNEKRIVVTTPPAAPGPRGGGFQNGPDIGGER
jgi:hypothetical protein